MRRLRRDRRLPEIELTPLIVVLFMRIVFFVLTAVFSESSIPVRLPSASGEHSSGGSVILNLDEKGRISMEGEYVSAENAVERSFVNYLEGKKVLVAADRDVPYGSVVSLLEKLRIRGVESAGLLVESGEKK